MNKFVVAIFPNETKAYQGVRELQELHQEGAVTVFATVVAQREANGTLTVKQRSDPGPLGLGVGALVGGLIGLFAGPVGAAVGMAAGSAAGGSLDLVHAGVSDEFLQDVQRDLTPGKLAVIAEVSEEWLAPIDSRMEALGATLVRERRLDYIDDLIERRADARRVEFAEWKAERAGEKAQRMESRFAAMLENAQKKLQRTADKAHERLDETKQEMEAKLDALQKQAGKAKPELRDRINQRIADVRTDFAQREKKLTHAYELVREALAGRGTEARP